MMRKVIRFGDSGSKIFFQYAIALLSLLLTLGAVRLYAYKSQHDMPHSNALRDFPTQIMEWKGGSDNDLGVLVINTLKVDEYVNRDYFKGDRGISLYIGYYHSHRNFVEIHTPENCQENAGWTILEKKIKTLEVKDSSRNKNIQYVEATYEKNGRKHLMLYFYKLIDETTTSFMKYKYLVVRNSIFRNRTDAAFIRIILPMNEKNPSESIMLGEGFLRDITPVLFQKLP